MQTQCCIFAHPFISTATAPLCVVYFTLSLTICAENLLLIFLRNPHHLPNPLSTIRTFRTCCSLHFLLCISHSAHTGCQCRHSVTPRHNRKVIFNVTHQVLLAFFVRCSACIIENAKNKKMKGKAKNKFVYKINKIAQN